MGKKPSIQALKSFCHQSYGSMKGQHIFIVFRFRQESKYTWYQGHDQHDIYGLFFKKFSQWMKWNQVTFVLLRIMIWLKVWQFCVCIVDVDAWHLTALRWEERCVLGFPEIFEPLSRPFHSLSNSLA